MAYRDNDLIKEYDRAAAKYTISASAKRDMQRLRRELIDANLWNTSNWSLLTGTVASNLKTTANLVSNLLALNPATGAVSSTVRAGRVSAKPVLEALEQGKNIYAIANGELGKVVINEYLKSVGPVGQTVNIIWDLSDDVKEMVYLQRDQARLRATIIEKLDDLDRSISTYENQLQNSREKIDTVNGIKGAIDVYCRDNKRQSCGTSLTVHFKVGIF
jgi:hypothetical protein